MRLNCEDLNRIADVRVYVNDVLESSVYNNGHTIELYVPERSILLLMARKNKKREAGSGSITKRKDGRWQGQYVSGYNPETGKRIKNCDGAVNWVHSQLKKSGELPDSWELSQCLFGEHLLLRRPEATVCLVESEKTAIICSGVMPEYVWLATGGKQNFKAEKCECLKGRKVILYPDLGAFEDWKNKGETIARSVGFSLSVSDVLERIATPEDRESGFDIADYVIKQLRTGVRSNTGGQTRVLPLTWEEKILQQMSARNPAVLQLIDALDLVSSSTQMRLRTCVA